MYSQHGEVAEYCRNNNCTPADIITNNTPTSYSNIYKDKLKPCDIIIDGYEIGILPKLGKIGKYVQAYYNNPILLEYLYDEFILIDNEDSYIFKLYMFKETNTYMFRYNLVDYHYTSHEKLMESFKKFLKEKRINYKKINIVK